MTFTFVDLFSGIGGFHQACAKLGGMCRIACDIDPKAREIYFSNYGQLPHDGGRGRGASRGPSSSARLPSRGGRLCCRWRRRPAAG